MSQAALQLQQLIISPPLLGPAAASTQALPMTFAQTPDVFQLLYPEEFYSKFYAAGVRPDGRPLGRARQTSINLGNCIQSVGEGFCRMTEPRTSRGW